jgi:hypothetical protein
MSRTSDIIDALIALINTTLPAYRTVDGYVSVDALDGGTLKREPVAMVFNPTLASDTIEFQQRSETNTFTVLLVRAPNAEKDPTEGLQLRTDTETLRTAVDDDPGLDALTDDVRVAGWDLHEESPTNTIASIIVESVTVTN